MRPAEMPGLVTLVIGALLSRQCHVVPMDQFGATGVTEYGSNVSRAAAEDALRIAYAISDEAAAEVAAVW